MDWCQCKTGIKSLTAREQEIAKLVSIGKTRGEIATQLGISVKTAEAHILNMYKRLGINNMAQLTRMIVTDELEG